MTSHSPGILRQEGTICTPLLIIPISPLILSFSLSSTLYSHLPPWTVSPLLQCLPCPPFLTLSLCKRIFCAPGKGQEPAPDHPHGPGGGSCLHCLLDAHSRLRHYHSLGQHPQLDISDHHLALLHCPGLHQQVVFSRSLV